MACLRSIIVLWLAMTGANASEPPRSVALEDAGYVVRRWSVEEGLPNQAVYALAQDEDGYLWIGTNRGLARFDGLAFEVFTLEGLSETASIVSLFSDSRGRLWIAEKWGSLILHEHGKFRSIRSSTDETSAIWFMSEDPEGTIWFAGWYGGDLLCFREDRLEPGPVRLPAHTAVTGLGSPAEGQFLFSSADGAYLLRTGKGESPAPIRVGRALCLRPEGAPLLLSGEGVCRLEGNTPVLEQRYPPMPKQAAPFVGQDAGGTLWHINRGPDGIEVFLGPPGGRTLRLEVQAALEELHPSHPTDLYTILLSNDGSVWLGTAGGLVQFRPTLFRQPSVLGRFKSGLNLVHIREDAAGQLWFVTHQESSCLNADRTTLTYTPIPGGTAWSTEGESVWHAFGTEVANWWRDPADRRWKARRRNTLPTVAKCLHMTRGGDLWAGTIGGPWRRTPNGFTLQGPAVPVVTMASDPSARVYALFADGSLRRYDNGRWHQLAEPPVGKVNALAIGEDGGLWVAGERPPLARWKDERWFSFDNQGIDWPQAVMDVLADDRGGLWLTTPNSGVLWADRRALDAAAEGRESRVDHKVFDTNDGLPTVVCADWPGAITQTRRGEIWVTTEKGPAVVDLDHLQRTRESSARQAIVIEEVRVDDAPVEFRAAADGDPAADPPALEMRPGQQRIEFVFSAPNFSAPEQVRFRYRLDGLDLDWVNGGTVRSTHYRDLPPGRYRFHVAATNSYGVWNDVGTSLDVAVLPAWWQRRSSQGAAVVVALAVVGLAGWLVVRGVRRRSEAQERFAQRLIASQEQERQRIAGDLHDSLGQDLVLIKQALDIEALETGSGERGNRPARSSLSSVADLAGHAIERVRSITDVLSPPELGRMGLAAALEEMANRASEHAGIPVRCRVTDLDRDWADDESINVYRIIQECLTNAIKHAEAQSIVISAKCRLDTLRVVVEDDGKGYNPNTPADGDRGAGHGLEGLKKRALMLGGTFLIRARPDRGTRCTLEIPLRRR